MSDIVDEKVVSEKLLDMADTLEQTFYEDLVKEVRDDFLNRQKERRVFDSQWQLNMNFLIGNQYTNVHKNGEVEASSRVFDWQEREVYNHIAPIVETRLARLGRVRPLMKVLPASNTDSDLYTAKLSTNVLHSAYSKLKVDQAINAATMWSEVCGTAFYKTAWNSRKGRIVGYTDDGFAINEGEIEVSAIPPFEIYPDSNLSSMADLRSIIHAKAYHKDLINDIWGVEVEGEDVDVFTLDNVNVLGGFGYSSFIPKLSKSTKSEHCVVIERYEVPSKKYPQGRLVIIAKDKLLYVGELPFINKDDNKRGLPFIRQASVNMPGSFWGTSVIERTIPIQRAYNAVKNRKLEFLNRIAMGVLTLEDGSVDVENLEEEGLSPGKVLVYRQGARPPQMMDTGRVPAEFSHEEDKLINEFVAVSGVSDLMKRSAVASNINSGVAMQLLIEQDDTRLSITADSIREAIRGVGEHILRLYKQFANVQRMSRITGKGGDVQLYYWTSSELSINEIIFETENELNNSPAQRRNMVFELFKAGLLHNEAGILTDEMRVRVLDMLGFGGWENGQDLSTMHIRRAAKENLLLQSGVFAPSEIDEHQLHIAEHTRFMLSGDYEELIQKSPHIEEFFLEHLRMHKKYKALELQTLMQMEI
ncbi:MAG: hypothetical protein FWB72_02510 [Firmicutes bacterium]|nr:hypothetical protein [Bacillota bacterium]